MPICAAVFDLDDTLYLERQYHRSGYQHISELLSSDETLRRELFAFQWNLFEQDGAHPEFDRLCEAFPDACNGHSSEDLRRRFDAHVPDITLMPRMGSLIARLHSRGIRIGIIADGDPPAQMNKIDKLGIGDMLDLVVLTESWGKKYRKPHERAFRHVTSEFGLRADELAYIADDPATDFGAPNALGWKTVRLRLPYQMHFASQHATLEDKPSLVISDIRALLAFLEVACELGDRAA